MREPEALASVPILFIAPVGTLLETGSGCEPTATKGIPHPKPRGPSNAVKVQPVPDGTTVDDLKAAFAPGAEPATRPVKQRSHWCASISIYHLWPKAAVAAVATVQCA